ncbi:MAG: hypothetical protein H0X51_02645 [Parachlamydiaceae bacterium]|nr:hypothetical protein [Parachlamydiaceae bacterium]
MESKKMVKILETNEREFKQYLLETLSASLKDSPLKSKESQLDELKKGIDVLYQKFQEDVQEGLLFFYETIKEEELKQLDAIMRKYALTFRSKVLHEKVKGDVELTNDDFRFLANIAKRKFADRHFVEANAMFRFITDLNPFYSPAWIGIALCFQEQGEMENADKIYEMAMPLCSDSPLFCLCAANHFLSRNRKDLAKEICQTALQEMELYHQKDSSEYREISELLKKL